MTFIKLISYLTTGFHSFPFHPFYPFLSFISVLRSSFLQGKRHLNKVQKKELGDAPSGIPCEICSISCPSKEAYDSHVNGKKHLAKVAAMGANGGSGGETQPIAAFYCTDCDVSTTSAEILEMHKQGKKHQAKVAKAAGGSTAGEVFQCEFCQVEVMGKGN